MVRKSCGESQGRIIEPRRKLRDEVVAGPIPEVVTYMPGFPSRSALLGVIQSHAGGVHQ